MEADLPPGWAAGKPAVSGGRSLASLYGVKTTADVATKGAGRRITLGALGRVGSRFAAKRLAAGGIGAAGGAAVGAPFGGVPAVPGAVIGFIGGVILGQAVGVAIDAAQGKGFSAKRAFILDSFFFNKYFRDLI